MRPGGRLIEHLTDEDGRERRRLQCSRGPSFKVAAAQVASVRGDIEANVATHAAAIQAAGERHVSVLVFPELSLTGYELDLARESIVSERDSRLSPLIASLGNIKWRLLSAPLPNVAEKPAIGAIVIAASGSTRTYRKMHLGGSEPNYFDAGDAPLALIVREHTVGIAICADSSRDTHPKAHRAGRDRLCNGRLSQCRMYVTDVPRLAEYAARYRMLVVMANHAASLGTYTSVGRSAGVESRGCRSGAI